MVAQQRRASFELGVVLFTLITFALCCAIAGPARAQFAFGLLGLLGFGFIPYYWHKGHALYDERDRAIQLRSMQVTVAILGLIATVALWATFARYQHAGVMPVSLLPWAAWWGWTLLVSIHSLTMLVLYRLG